MLLYSIEGMGGGDHSTPPGGMSELQKLVNMQPQVMSTNMDEKPTDTASESG